MSADNLSRSLWNLTEDITIDEKSDYGQIFKEKFKVQHNWYNSTINVALMVYIISILLGSIFYMVVDGNILPTSFKVVFICYKICI